MYEFSDKYAFSSVPEVEACSFLSNSNIKVGGEIIRHKIFINNNIHYIKQLKIGGCFLTHQEFVSRYNVDIDFLTFNSTLSAIKKYLSMLKTEESNKEFLYPPALNIILNNTKGASKIYQAMLVNDNDLNKGFLKWQESVHINREEWQNSFSSLKTTTKDTKLRWFQFRVIHNILTTNRSVSKFNKQQCHLCEFCKSHSETIHHLMWRCDKVRAFWQEVTNLINNRCKHTYNFKIDEKLVLFGKNDSIKTDTICDLIILMGKYFIYRCKVQGKNPNIRMFVIDIYNRYCVEKLIYQNSNRFKINWDPYLDIFRSLM